jgi:DNA-binding beta-propeller fold protein YncE
MGKGLFIWPHGLEVDADGNIWVTDAVRDNAIPKGDGRGHVAYKFSPDGEVLMTLGTLGEPGGGETHFRGPADVVVSSSGDIFVADGHWEDGNNRVVKFSPDGEYIGEWGKTGYGPGEFRVLHALAVDSQDRIYVADRPNARVQIFDTDGNHISTWRQFGTPSGIYVDHNDKVYVADSESDWKINPGWEVGIRIGDAQTGWVTEFIRFPWADPRVEPGSGAEFAIADKDGNVYAGEPFRRYLQKYYRIDSPRKLED